MPYVLTLEGANLGRLGCMGCKNPPPGRPSPGCVNCTPISGIGDAADVNRLTAALIQYTQNVASANQTARIIGYVGAVAGIIAGALVGRRYDTKGTSLKTLGGAAIGGLGVGFGAYYASQYALMPPMFVAPPAGTTSQVLSILAP